MSGAAYTRLVEALRQRGGKVNANGDNASAQCPAHDDSTPSLGLRAIEGSVLVCCGAGCRTEDIVASLGLTMSDLYDSPRGQSYVYPDGRIVDRSPRKKFRQRGDTKGKSLFRVDKLGFDASTVYVVEGEKDVFAVESVGGTAVCSAMGAGKAHLADWTPLQGFDVIIVADRDEPGRDHAAVIAGLLRDIAKTVRIVESAVGKDVSDHLAAGKKLDELTAGDSDLKSFIERGIEIELDKLRIRREAARRLDAEERPVIIYPPVTSLAELLDQPDDTAHYRIDQVAPKQGNIILSAQFKAGKTTLVNNLVRSLVDSDPFLGRFTVAQPAQHLVLIDDEMGRNTVRRWLREQKIRNTKAVADVITLRGRVSSFNILDDKIRDQWAARLGDLGCDYLMFDCLRPVLDALGLDENRDVGRFLVPLDALLADAGIPDSFIVQHMGHTGERSRGDSRLQDWPDATWRIVRDTEEPNSPRFFSAYGRDVDVYEGRLSFDPGTRRLTYAAGSRSDAKTEAAARAVIQLLAAGDDPLSYRGIENDLAGGHTQKAIRDGIAQAVRQGFVTVTEGPKRSKLHAIAYPCSECGMPVASQRARHESCVSESQELFK